VCSSDLPAANLLPPKLQIGLPLTQRILQLHGGRLRIEDDAVDGLSVMLELPTGAPLRNNQHLDMLQAQIYAEDLSKLMARTRQRSTSLPPASSSLTTSPTSAN
jgi:hypothetical protein